MNEKINSYDKYWLARDMENMGYLFEYCDEYCKKLYKIEIDNIKFLQDFLVSDLRKLMEIGHPQLVSESAEDTVEKFIEVDNHGNYENYKGKTTKFYYRQLYWVGMMYAYIHYMADIKNNRFSEYTTT